MRDREMGSYPTSQDTPWGGGGLAGSPATAPAPQAVSVMPPPPIPGLSPTTPSTGWVPEAKPKGWSRGKKVLLVLVILGMAFAGFIALGLAFIGFSQSAVDSSVPIDAQIGECYRRTSSPEPAVPCDGLHHYEVYSALYWTQDANYPGRIDRFGGSPACEEDFEWYTNENYWTSSLDYSIPVPTREEWDEGARITVCALHESDLTMLTESKAG